MRLQERGRTYNMKIVNITRCKYGSKVPCWVLCFHFVVQGFVILNIGPALAVLSFHCFHSVSVSGYLLVKTSLA